MRQIAWPHQSYHRDQWIFLFRRENICNRILEKVGAYAWRRVSIVSGYQTIQGSYQAKSTSSVGTATCSGNFAKISKYRRYFAMRRVIVAPTAGECIQSIECIFSIKDPCRITAPTRSRANADELSQYRDIIRRTAIFSALSNLPTLLAAIWTRSLLAKALSNTARISLTVTVLFLRTLVHSRRSVLSPPLIIRLGNKTDFSSRGRIVRK